MSQPLSGHDGPYAAPLATAQRAVPADWIDYNGHMNVAYYTMAMDRAMDVMFDDHLGLGEAHAAANRQGPYVIQMHMHYLGEVLEGEQYACRFTLLDHDAKRLHILSELVVGDEVRAMAEHLVMNVDLEARRSAPYPDWAQARLARMKADHAVIPRPPRLGATLGIRRQPNTEPQK